MKLSDVSTKLTCMKSTAVRVLASGMLAGAVLAATPAAQAQHVSFGVQFGGPVYSRGYYAPPPVVYAPQPVYGYGYGGSYGFHDREEWRRHEEFLRRERWEREHRFHDQRFDGYRHY